MFSLSDLYLAYRKAKAEAYFESTHFHALSFTRYEQALHANLTKLRIRLISKSTDWFLDRTFLGDHAYIPKSVNTSIWDSEGEGHFRALDPSSEWRRRFSRSRKPAEASLRLVIRPTVDFQIISALWILKVGHLFDATLDTKTSYGNRLRRTNRGPMDLRTFDSGVNTSTPGLFAPYFSAYREWRELGLSKMETALANEQSILAITMDIERFYHRVSPQFLVRKSFLDTIGLKLTSAEKSFTNGLLSAIATWYKETPDFQYRPEGALPVGLSASKIIANVLLVAFDRAIVTRATPLYYGRYVDDIFLVLEATENDYGAEHVTERLLNVLAPLVKLSGKAVSPNSLTLKLPYAKDSELIFSAEKQKIFALSSAHGADLIHHIRDQIRQQSSEYRMLPEVPTTGIAMASRALLATPNASLQVDALRKADVVSVRRLGFSLLLSDVETYAADLKPASWVTIRREFYGLIGRHVITPSGFFDYFSYIPRVFGLMLACGDLDEAKGLIANLTSIANLLKETTTLGLSQSAAAFELCLNQYALALLEAGLKSATAKSTQLDRGYLSVLRRLKSLSTTVRMPSNAIGFQNLVMQVLLADWGRRPYKDYWFTDQNNDEKGPKVPTSLAVQRQLRLGAIRHFRKSATDLKVPHWPALAFPTRPLLVDEIALVAPKVLTDPLLFKSAILLLRGARVASYMPMGFRLDEESESAPILHFTAPGTQRKQIRVAITSRETTDQQWRAAARGKHDRSVKRYMAFNGLINQILKEQKRPDYIVMPELSVPLRWAIRAARKLASNGVSFLAGVEYHRDRATKKLRNDCLISLTTRWPGYPSSVVVLQSKMLPSHDERLQLKKVLGRDRMFFEPIEMARKPTVYTHRNFCFSALICSDLTNLSHRNSLRGHVDALFGLEWNPDTKTFSALVESTANDLHAYVVQVNNRRYGDSRIRSPAKEDFRRDTVQVKGGVVDYYVIGEIDYLQLRKEQRRSPSRAAAEFKPLPIGYVMSPGRKKPVK